MAALVRKDCVSLLPACTQFETSESVTRYLSEKYHRAVQFVQIVRVTRLAILGRIPGATLRLPLTEMAKKNRDRLEAALAELPRA